MRKNMGTADRMIRLIVAAIIFTLYFTGIITATAGIVLMAIAAVFVLTSAIATCPLYLPFRISTRKKR